MAQPPASCGAQLGEGGTAMEGLAQPDKRKEIVNRVVPLGAIEAHSRNYQQHPESQIAELMASLRRFGQVRSLVVQEQDGSYLMVAGHGVMEAARPPDARVLMLCSVCIAKPSCGLELDSTLPV